MKHYGRYTIALIITIFIFSCGRSSDTPADSGGIAPKVQWDYRPDPDIKVAAGFKPLTEESSSVKGKPASNGNGDNLLHKAPLGVYKVRATLLDTSNNPVLGFQTTKDVAPGDSGTITFTSVPPGTYNIRLEGLDTTGTDVLYTGQTNSVVAELGRVAEPTVIARYTRADNASPGSSNKSPADGATNIPANTKISVQVSDNDAGIDASSIVLTVQNEDVTKKSSIIGTSDIYTILYTPSSNLSGTVTVTLRASDLANPANSMATETWSFTISEGGATDSTAPTSPSISFGSITETSSQLVTVTLSASDDTGITGYYLSESSTTPSVTSSGWTSVTSTTSYNANVNFTLSSGNGSKTVNVWFKDAVGNISVSASATINFNQTDTTAPTSPSVSINSGASSTTSTAVTLSLSATDNVGVTGYCAKESSATPSTGDACWTSVTSTTYYSANRTFTLSSETQVGSYTKTVYVWFRDSAGNLSASASDSITLTVSDTTAPLSPSVSINSGASSTPSTSVTLTLSATDNVGVTGYCAKESSATPSTGDACWTSVSSTTSYSADVSFTLSSGTGTKTVYVWFKDTAGNISASANDSITYGPTTLASGLSNPVGIVVDANNVYWTEINGNTVKKVSINGGTVTILASGLSSPNGIAVDSANVYWVEQNSNGTAKKVSVNGGTVTTLASGLISPSGIAIDSTDVYFTETSSSSGTVKKVSINGGTVTTLASGLNAPSHIAVDSTNVYWIEGNTNTVKKVSIAGGTVTTLASGLDYPNGIAIDSANVYWTEWNSNTVKKVSINGGTVTTLASGLSSPLGIAVDANNVYWTEYNGSTVKKVSINGGTTTTLASGLNAPRAITVDSTYAYWTESASNTVKKIAK